MAHRRSPGRPLLAGLIGAVALLLVAFALSRMLGFRLTRVSTHSPPMAQSELDRAAASPAALGPTTALAPRSVIVMVADGLGFAHLAAAGIEKGAPSRDLWRRFTATGWHATHSAGYPFTDSAAAATALSIGEPADPGAVGLAASGEERPTLFERATALGYRTGIVTDSYVWDATPAAFVTRVPDRDEAAQILEQLAAAPLDVLIGELEDVGEGEVPEVEATVATLSKRYVVAVDPADLAAANRAGEPIAWLFHEDQVQDLESTPTLPELVTVALDRMASAERPFLLLVESEEIDSASHRSDFARVMRGLEAIETVAAQLLDFAAGDGNTLLVFTSDHETGGLSLTKGRQGWHAIRGSWSTRDHTAVDVPLMAYGPGSELFGGAFATWEVGRRLAASLQAGAEAVEEPGAADLAAEEPGTAVEGEAP